jgi:hypothetical protein
MNRNGWQTLSVKSLIDAGEAETKTGPSVRS